MLDLALERETLETLLSRQAADENAWAALVEDGWLDAVCESGGAWPLAGIALAVAETIAAKGRSLPVGAQLAAGSTLAELNAGSDAGQALAVLTDLRRGDGALTGRWWGPEDATTVVWSEPDGSVWTHAGHAALSSEPLLVLEDVHVFSCRLDEGAAERAAVDPELSARHEARAAFLLAAEALGATRAAVEATIAYLGQRAQFGRPLASQQALQHRAVDMHLVTMMASYELDRVARAWEGGDAIAGSWTAKMLAGERGLWAAEQAVQLHGGIGFTWELGIHFAVRRAERARLLLGGVERCAAEVRRAVPPRRPDLRDWSLEFRPERTRDLPPQER